MKIKANKILAVVCVIAMVMTMIVPMTLTASAETVTETITFDANKTQRTSFSSNQQVWASENVTFTNNKASSSNAIADYSNPVRLYAGSEVVIEAPGTITSVTIVSDGTSKYKTALQNALTTAGITPTVSGNNYTFALTSDTVTLKFTAQARFKSIAVTYEALAEGDCAHENATPTGGFDATCTEDGEASFICDDCGEEFTEVIKATGHNSVDNICTECGELEFPEPTLAEAVAMADGTKVFLRDVVVVEINTPWNSNYGNITVTVEDANGDTLYCYRLATNVEVGDILNITGSIGSYNNAKQLAAGATAVITGKTEVEEPDPVEVTLADAAELEDGTLVLVQGIVTEINTAWSDSYNNISVTITDANGDSLYLYRVYTKVALGEEIAVTGKMATYNNARQLGEGSTAVITKASPLPQLNAVNAHMSVAYKYVEDGTTLSDSQFVLKCGVDAGLANIEGVTAYGIAVTAGNMTVYYTSETSASWVAGDEVISVAIGLGDIINDQDKLGTEFTVSAFVVADGITWESTSAKTYSVAGMIDEYDSMGIEEVAHLYNVLVGYGLI